MARSPNYFKAALLLPANLVGLGTAAASSALTGEPLPALVALGVEALYLLVTPFTARFRRAVRAEHSQQDAEEAQREMGALLQELQPSQRQHYQALVDLREKILANYQKLPGGGVLVGNSAGRLDTLLTSFLRLVSALNHYRQYLGSAHREPLEKEVRELEAELAGEANPRLRDVKEKRLEILRKRLARFEQARESREVVSHQLAGIEDLMRLTHEQSITIRDPESVNRQLVALSAEAEATDETVREMERFMEFTEEVGAPMTHGTKVR